MLQDSSRVEEIQKECEESTDLIPRLQEEMPKLQQLLLDEEAILEEIKEDSKGECIYVILIIIRSCDYQLVKHANYAVAQ